MPSRQPANTLPVRRHQSEQGVILIFGLVGLLLVIALVMASSDRTQAVRTLTEIEHEADVRARKAAESGLVDALSWLRRQYEQPVAVFAPKRNMSFDPPIDETDDAEIGLVRSFEIANGYWGQYKVRRPVPAEPFVDTTGNGLYDEGEAFTDTNGDGKRSTARGCRDISFERGASKSGVIWYLESEGGMFRRGDQDAPLGEGHNARLGHAVLGTEVRRLSLVLPTSAAIVAGEGSEMKLEGAVIESPILGLAYRPDSGEPDYKTLMGDTKRSEFKAPVEHMSVNGWTTGDDNNHVITCQDVFGVSIQTLRSMADYNVKLVSKIPKSANAFQELMVGESWPEKVPITIPENSLTVITPKGNTLKVDKQESMVGRGIIVVDGNLEIKQDTLTHFSGILFVTGDMKVENEGAFEGTVIVGGKLEVRGELPAFKVKKSGRKKKSKKSWKSFKSKKSKKSIKIKPDRSVWFGHNPDLVAEVVRQIGNYRKFKSSYDPPRLMPDGRPDEAFGTAGSLAATSSEK